MFKNTQKSGDSRAAGPKLLVAGYGLRQSPDSLAEIIRRPRLLEYHSLYLKLPTEIPDPLYS